MKLKLKPYHFFYIYLGSIFIFAAIYSFMPNSFYHSTVQYESVLLNDKVELSHLIENNIKQTLLNCHPSGFIMKNDVQLNINKIFIHDLNFDVDSIHFYLYADIQDSIQNELPSQVLFLSISITPIVAKDSICIYRIDNKLKVDQFGAADMFHWVCTTFQFVDSLYPIDYGWVEFDRNTSGKIFAYSKAIKGFPYYNSGQFARMLYLSSVTITTVGYGDIVPLTNAARLLVSMEAIWGIIIIGLFLNTIANSLPNNQK